MAKVRILVNTRLNRVFYGRDSIVEVSDKDAGHLASLGVAALLVEQNPSNAPEKAEKVEEDIKQPEAEEKPKAKAKKAVKK